MRTPNHRTGDCKWYPPIGTMPPKHTLAYERRATITDGGELWEEQTG